MGGGAIAGARARRFKARVSSGGTFAIVELLDPSDALYFKRIMRRKGLRDLTPPVKGNTFRSRSPTEKWMKEVANLDPDWWYISGHFARTKYGDARFKFNAGFFNKSYYDNVFHHVYDHSVVTERGGKVYAEISPPNMHIRMEYKSKRDDLKYGNFFEKYGSGSYPHAKIVLAVGCNTLVFPFVRRYLSQLFPKAIILGHIHKNPANAVPIIRNFLRRYFSRPSKANDWNHIVSSWLSYHDRVKNSIMKRGYGLAALYKGDVSGIDIDKTYPRVLAQSGDDIYRFRFRSISRRGRKVDVLFVYDSKGKIVVHECMYQGDRDFKSFDFDPYARRPEEFPYLSSSNVARNRGY